LLTATFTAEIQILQLRNSGALLGLWLVAQKKEMGNCCVSNQWYGCLVPLQQIIGCLCQLGITKILGPLLLSLAHILILGIIYLFYLFFLPLIAKDSQFIVRISFFIYLSFLTFLFLLLFVVLDPFPNWIFLFN
jgi:hypothetical protein